MKEWLWTSRDERRASASGLEAAFDDPHRRQLPDTGSAETNR